MITPGGDATKPVIDNAVTDFPDPLSPIKPKHSPLFILNEIFFEAKWVFPSNSKAVDKFLINKKLFLSSLILLFDFIRVTGCGLISSPLLNLGSRASLIPSPNKFTPITIKKIIAPGI